MILEPLRLSIRNNRAYLTFSLVRSTTGTVQSKDIWKMLSDSFGLPWVNDEFICSRAGTYQREGEKRKTPFDPEFIEVYSKG
jgi:hypothetical protein